MSITNISHYHNLSQQVLNGKEISEEEGLEILDESPLNILQLLHASYLIRHHYWQNKVQVHIINNVQNGLCPEDCHYCPQNVKSLTPIIKYPMKSEESIFQEAQKAYEAGAHRYCLVLSGTGPNKKMASKIGVIVQKIKEKYPMEICVSAGIANEEQLKILKDYGVDRINHNLNTSEQNYPSICTSHTYQDRLNTINTAKKIGLEVCSGIIVGMGENKKDLIELAKTLRHLEVKSIPLNFLLPIDGTQISSSNLFPYYCLKVLALFRFLNPSAEIRVGAGREFHFRDLQPFAFFPANSLFLEGYLNVKGSSILKTLQMIKDLHLEIVSDFNVDEIIKKTTEVNKTINQSSLKNRSDLYKLDCQ